MAGRGRRGAGRGALALPGGRELIERARDLGPGRLCAELLRERRGGRWRPHRGDVTVGEHARRGDRSRGLAAGSHRDEHAGGEQRGEEDRQRQAQRSLQAAIERGELVAVLGDRVGVNEKTATANFLGAPARFPTGPYTLAALLRCPIYLTFGLYRAPNRYDLYCEPLCEQLELPRGAREAALAAHVQRYADRLEHYCRLAPHDWFNFYDFWRTADASEERP